MGLDKDSTKGSAKRALEAVFKEGQDYRMLNTTVKHLIGEAGGTNKEIIRLTTTCFKKFCMMVGTEVGEAVCKYCVW